MRHDRLRGTPVILTATGGRPLFGFFGALSLPTTLYAIESDFNNCLLVSGGAISQRVAPVANEAIEALRPRVRPPRSERAVVSAEVFPEGASQISSNLIF